MKTVTALLTLALAAPAGGAAERSPLWGSLESGPHDRALELSRKALDLPATDKASTPERRELIRQSAEQKIEQLTKPN